jgi:hypothetical protein
VAEFVAGLVDDVDNYDAENLLLVDWKDESVDEITTFWILENLKIRILYHSLFQEFYRIKLLVVVKFHKKGLLGVALF